MRAMPLLLALGTHLLLAAPGQAQVMQVTRLEPAHEIGAHLLAMGTYYENGLEGAGITWGHRLGDGGAVEFRGDLFGAAGDLGGLATLQLRTGGTPRGSHGFRSIGIVWAAGTDDRPHQPRGAGLAVGGGVMPWISNELGLRVELQALIFPREGVAVRAAIGLVVGR